MESNLTQLEGKMEKHTIIVGEADRKAVRIWKTEIALSITLTYVTLVQYVTQPEQNAYAFQVHIGHSSA